MDISRPTVRVEDATLVPQGGPARLVLADVPRAREIAQAVAAARGVSSWQYERLIVTAVPSRLVDAAGRVGGSPLADVLRSLVEPAINAWLTGPADIAIPNGVLETSQRPLVAGILNVTPDSFSDGGTRYPDNHPDAAIEAGRALAAAGADLIDIGGESTRPGSDPVDEDEELARVVPVVKALASDGHHVSIDTTKAAVALAAVDAGAIMVNDVSAGRLDEQLLPTVAKLGVPYVLTHMQGVPRTMQQDPTYGDVVGDVFDQLAWWLSDAEEAGIDRANIIVDPGIGFGKTVEHNLTLLRRLRELASLARPMMVGTSRKSFLGKIAGGVEAADQATDPVNDRLEASIATATLAVAEGARIVRVHDVPETVRAINVAHAVVGR